MGLGALSAAIGWAVGRPLGIPVWTAAVAGANGLVFGWLQVYSLRTPTGWWAWFRDVTWALPNTFLGLVVAFLQLTRPDRGYSSELSYRHDRIVFTGGWRLKKGYTTTIGNVVSNAFDRREYSGPELVNRHRFLDRHEHQHVLQGRRWGFLFLVVYVGWSIVGLIRATVWKLAGNPERWPDLVMTASYFSNPFERTAYRADINWPPQGAISRHLRS